MRIFLFISGTTISYFHEIINIVDDILILVKILTQNNLEINIRTKIQICEKLHGKNLYLFFKNYQIYRFIDKSSSMKILSKMNIENILEFIHIIYGTNQISTSDLRLLMVNIIDDTAKTTIIKLLIHKIHWIVRDITLRNIILSMFSSKNREILNNYLDKCLHK